MRSIIFSLLFLISVSLCAAPLKLAENGKTNYTIVLSNKASAIDKCVLPTPGGPERIRL